LSILLRIPVEGMRSPAQKSIARCLFESKIRHRAQLLIIRLVVLCLIEPLFSLKVYVRSDPL